MAHHMDILLILKKDNADVFTLTVSPMTEMPLMMNLFLWGINQRGSNSAWFKRTVHLKMKCLSLFTLPHVYLSLYDCIPQWKTKNIFWKNSVSF